MSSGNLEKMLQEALQEVVIVADPEAKLVGMVFEGAVSGIQMTVEQALEVAETLKDAARTLMD